MSGAQETPNDKVKVMFEYTPMDFGPLNVIDGNHYNNFIGGHYYLVTPKEDLVLYRLYGGNAGEYGQYWSTEPRDGNLGYRMDAAVPQQWNSFDKSAELYVPAGVCMYEGRVSRQGNFLGGGWQVFIPREVVNQLVKIQPHILRQMNEETRNRTYDMHVDEINKIQSSISTKYDRELADRLLEDSRNNGSQLWALPSEIRSIITSGKTETGGKFKAGKYLIHQTSMPKHGGGRRNMSVYVRIEFDKSQTRTYISGRTHVTEITNYYNRITEFTET